MAHFSLTEREPYDAVLAEVPALYVIGDDEFVIRLHGKWYRAHSQQMLTPDQFVDAVKGPEVIHVR